MNLWQVFSASPPSMVGTGAGAAASVPSHQGAAQCKLSSNIDSAAEGHVGRREQGARLICGTPNLWGRERDGKRGRERKGEEERGSGKETEPSSGLMLHSHTVHRDVLTHAGCN